MGPVVAQGPLLLGTRKTVPRNTPKQQKPDSPSNAVPPAGFEPATLGLKVAHMQGIQEDTARWTTVSLVIRSSSEPTTASCLCSSWLSSSRPAGARQSRDCGPATIQALTSTASHSTAWRGRSAPLVWPHVCGRHGQLRAHGGLVSNAVGSPMGPRAREKREPRDGYCARRLPAPRPRRPGPGVTITPSAGYTIDS